MIIWLTALPFVLMGIFVATVLAVGGRMKRKPMARPNGGRLPAADPL